jgi:hypothetical protein
MTLLHCVGRGGNGSIGGAIGIVKTGGVKTGQLSLLDHACLNVAVSTPKHVSPIVICVAPEFAVLDSHSIVFVHDRSTALPFSRPKDRVHFPAVPDFHRTFVGFMEKKMSSPSGWCNNPEFTPKRV